MRVYVLSRELIKSIIIRTTLVQKKCIKTLYSNEGIFNVDNNILYRLINIADELPAEELLVNNNKIIIDKNKLIFIPESFQLSPVHISETITKYIYSLPDNENVQFIIEKHFDEAQDEAYFCAENNYEAFEGVFTYIKHTFL